MKTRLMTGAYLFCGDELLLMKRSMQKKLNPGLWSVPGGHLESDEMNDPQRACLREIEEETGIAPSLIEGLALRYMAIRDAGEEVYVNYLFVGRLSQRPTLVPCDEGEFHWVRAQDAGGLPMSYSMQQMTRHLLENRDCETMFICPYKMNQTDFLFYAAR